MGDVTAVNMDVVTEKSGHAFTPMAVSVCITPAAPSPLPIPYVVTTTSTDGVTDPAMRTKINGAAVCTVGRSPRTATATSRARSRRSSASTPAVRA